MAAFKSPVVYVNSNGWGPTEDNVPEQFRDLPFAPFGKGDLGKGFRVADFTANGAAQQRFQNRFRGKDEPVRVAHWASILAASMSTRPRDTPCDLMRHTTACLLHACFWRLALYYGESIPIII